MSKTPKYYIHRNKLFLMCSFTWFIAGASVFKTGIQAWQTIHLQLVYKLFFTGLTFSAFNFIIFAQLTKKYISRIINLPLKNHPLSFFSIKGWSIMFFMMGLGFSIRKFNLLPDSFIATFYVGLSIALTIVGFKFIYAYNKNNSAE